MGSVPGNVIPSKRGVTLLPRLEHAEDALHAGRGAQFAVQDSLHHWPRDLAKPREPRVGQQGGAGSAEGGAVSGAWVERREQKGP